MTLEEKLSSVLEVMLLDSDLIAAQGDIMTPFTDEKISLPAVFLKITKGEELIQNSGIHACTADIELRYEVGRDDNQKMKDVWKAVDATFSCAQLNIIADDMNEIRPDIVIHSLEWTESEPTS
ncbi:MAG: hypothetical protein IIB67_11615, partial [Proteobacteria bacterium]|nr:hypothetical protein [Pseudomonadota bacterium]